MKERWKRLCLYKEAVFRPKRMFVVGGKGGQNKVELTTEERG
jgi:hypothetical protein